ENLNVCDYSKDFLEFVGRAKLTNLEQIVPWQDLINLKNILFGTDKGSPSLSCFRIKTKKGDLSWFAATLEKQGEFGESIRMELNDIQSLKTDYSDGHFDKMTGLYNKSTIIDYANDLMHESPTKHFYFFLMDIDNFKSVNDTYGHMRGDEVIIDVAHTAQEIIGDKGVIGRIGGDEFMLVLEKIDNEPRLREILRDIRYTIRDKYQDESNNKTISVSMGGALFPDFAKDYESMFQLADKMLYLAKTKGKDRYIIYTPFVHGKIVYDGNVMTIQKHMLMDQAKSDLMMEFLDDYYVKKTIPFKTAMERVLDTYGLDEGYVLGEDKLTSHFGIKQVSGKDGSGVEDSSLDISPITSEDYKSLFNIYPLKTINIYDLQKDNYPIFSEFMTNCGYRVLVVYHMTKNPAGGYIIFASNATSSCRLSEIDFTDLAYFCRMTELSDQCPKLPAL
ncbi:MAG: GGDEF domain-containing protein, partial [Butyrivibrio sp.]|nr:GGDEF domain-containing protein [Butyrivibrio sp.]